MKQFLLCLILIASSISVCYSQKGLDTKIIGRWKVVFVQYADTTAKTKEELKKIEALRKVFLRSEFEFKKDRNFSFDFDMAEMRMVGKHWKYNDAAKSFLIQEWKDKNDDNYSLMEIIVKQKEERVFFMIEEVPFILEVEKKE